MSDRKQLKKNDFLSIITAEPMTRDDIVTALADYDYLDSYLDYLTDHFVSRGLIAKTEDGLFHRKSGKSSTAPKDIFRVVIDEAGEYAIESKKNSGNISAEDKEAGWSVTANAAVKKESQHVFAVYKAQTLALKALVSGSDDTPTAE